MSITQQVQQKIRKMPSGFVFGYKDFLSIEGAGSEAIIKALNRTVKQGGIEKISKGRFFKPENSPFGPLQPKEEEIVKDLLYKDGKRVGYLTGLSIYNSLGFTTQVSNTLQIGSTSVRPRFKRGRYTISYLRQKNDITNQNVELLQILDIIRYIKKIPDSSPKKSVKQLIKLINQLNSDKIKRLMALALAYPPSTRALLGAILDKGNQRSDTGVLKTSLNPITTYKMGQGLSSVLTSAKNWNLI